MEFIRFGEIPTNGKSINYTKLTIDQREDVTDIIRFGNGADLESKIKWLLENARSWRGISVNDIFEDGISAFECSNNLPDILNIDQARTLAIRVNDNAYIIKGEKIGNGQDGEPLVKVSETEKAPLQKIDYVRTLIGALSGYYKTMSGSYDENAADQIFTFYDDANKESYIFYKGYEFRHPVSDAWTI